MRHLLLLCSAFSLVSPLPSYTATQHNIQDRNAPRNPGRPLGPDDFFLARQLPIAATNLTAERMMLPLTVRAVEPEKLELQMEELELLGSQTESAKQHEQKNGLSKLTYHWPNGVVPYTIDPTFASTERAAIASGINHIHENSCVRFVERNGEA